MTASARVTYRVATSGSVQVKLKGRDATPTGVMNVVRGQLEVDVLALENSRGYIEVDLGSLRMFADDGEAIDPLRTEEARNWLRVGADQPPTDQERRRWARFELRSIDEASHARPEMGKPVAPPAPSASSAKPSSAAKPSAAPSGSAAPPSEPPPKGYEVKLRATGALTLNSVRVERTIRFLARFYYAQDTDPNAAPSRIELETVRPIMVGLKSHDIKPRDAKGVFVAAGMKLLGKQVGRDAAVSLRLEAERPKNP